MKYTNSEIRRQDRLLDTKSALELLKQGEFGVLSMRTENEGVYGIPINYAWDGNQSIYFHCAHEGQKLKCLDFCNEVSFCVVGNTKVVSNKFTTNYESIILKCSAARSLAENERMKALQLIIEKYSPKDKEVGMKYAEKSFHITEIIRLDIKDWSGKCKIVKNVD